MRLLAALALAAVCGAAGADSLKVGSKRFTESYILGEILARTAPAQHRPGLGNTGIVFAGSRPAPSTSTRNTPAPSPRKSSGCRGAGHRRAEPRPFRGTRGGTGFNNGYALAMREDRAEKLGVRTLSDLARQPRLKLGLSQEFIGREDGWPGLKASYRLPFSPVGLDHGLAYEALAAGDIDVMDVYTTDGKILGYRMRVLADDRRYFPRYEAVLLHRSDAPARFPKEFEALQKLEGRIDEGAMIRMNAAAELEGKSFAQAAALFFGEETGKRRTFLAVLFGPDFWRLTGEHLLLVFVSLAASVVAGVPLGMVAAKLPRAAQPVLAAVGVIQTIPALALLAFLIALVGTIGVIPALIALFLYALLPIVRNTYAGIAQGARGPVQAGLALGLRPGQILLRIELPLATPAILAGIKTSAVINVGTATIAAFIGAGGYGERIAAGLALNDNATLLAGAVPAALLALAVQGMFELAERTTGVTAWTSKR